MIEKFPVREAPRPSASSTLMPCKPDASNEPVLNLENIQGNIISGFNKDFQLLLFLEIIDSELFRDWLADLTPFVATAGEVTAFNNLYKEVRRRRGESRALSSTWLNMAISFKGLKKIAPIEEVRQFRDEAFRMGLYKRSKELGDPTQGPGSPSAWVIGGPRNEADLVLIFAADREDDLNAEVDRIERSIASTSPGSGGSIGVRILHRERGSVLPPPLKGHEHFGFLDGISQPGLRGRMSKDPHDVLTLRQNPRSQDQGKPGQDLLWPGEFVFGYAGQDASDIKTEGPDSLYPKGRLVAPEWARDGSYLVFRRLTQNVPMFRTFLAEVSRELNIPAELLAAKVIGRFPSGAPLMRTQVEDPKLGENDCFNNDFEFSIDDEDNFGVENYSEHEACQCKMLPSHAPDNEGVICPHAAHVRKVYPRNDHDRFPGQTGEATNQKRRIIRRGIPFGPSFTADSAPSSCDTAERGLLFLSYQTSIVDQFEYIQKTFANTAEIDPVTGEVMAGHDLIIGQNGGGKRSFVVPVNRGGRIERCVVAVDRQWTLPTGGGYFFAPSIKALERFSQGLR